MAKMQVPDYSGFKITKLPPGRAAGAGDLMAWSHNRALGRSGVDSTDEVRKTVTCRECDHITSLFIRRKRNVIEKISLQALRLDRKSAGARRVHSDASRDARATLDEC